MEVVIFGRESCPYCYHALRLAERLKRHREDFTFRYVDMDATGLSKADLSKRVGKTVTTVPQVFVDEQPIGGFTEFDAYVKQYNLLQVPPPMPAPQSTLS